MSSLNPKVPLKHPQTHTHTQSPASPCQTRPVRGTINISGKEIKVQSSARLWFLIQNCILMVGPGILHSSEPHGQDLALLLHQQEASPSPAAWSRVSEKERASHGSSFLPA